MRRFASRGLDLEQFKEPAISLPIHSFSDVKTVFLPISSELCISANQHLECGQLLSHGVRPDSIDSFASVKGVAAAIGEFEFEKFEGQSFLQLDADSDFVFESYEALEVRDLSDDDIMFAARECGILNTTTKTTLSEILDMYPNGVKNLVIDAVDDEPYVSSRISQLLSRTKYISHAIKALNRLFGAKNVCIEVYGKNGDVSVRIPQSIGRYPVKASLETYPVSKRFQSDEDTVYIDISALLAFYYAAVKRRPYTNTVVTVAGDCVKKSRNVEVPIGTSIGDILNYCGLRKKPALIVLGGSMTGYSVDGTDIPVLKSTKAILAFTEEPEFETTTCVGCGRCIDVCPQKLLPYYIYSYYLDNNIEKLYRLSADKCTECGCCSYICPAKIDLREYVKMSRRTLLKEMWQNEQDSQNNQSALSEK